MKVKQKYSQNIYTALLKPIIFIFRLCFVQSKTINSIAILVKNQINLLTYSFNHIPIVKRD